MNTRISRRRLFRVTAAAGSGGLLAGYLNRSVGTIGDIGTPPSALASSNFIILAANADIPPIVQQPAVLWPRICGAGDLIGVPPPAAEYQSLQGPDDLASVAGCPAYRLSSPPSGVTLEGASVTRTATQVVVGGDVQYTWIDPPTGRKLGSLFILLAKYYPSPFPLWEDDIPEGETGLLQAVSYLPMPGYIHLWDTEYQLYWIEDGVLYIVFADRAMYPDPEATAALLVT